MEEFAEKQGKFSHDAADVEALIRREVSGVCDKLVSYRHMKKVNILNGEFPKITTRSSALRWNL